MSLLLSPLLIDYHKFPKQQKNIYFTCGCTHLRAPADDAMRDTMEDVVAGPNTCVILENAKGCITTSRTAVTEGMS